MAALLAIVKTWAREPGTRVKGLTLWRFLRATKRLAAGIIDSALESAKHCSAEELQPGLIEEFRGVATLKSVTLESFPPEFFSATF